MVNIRAMAHPVSVEVTVTFGPTSSILLPRAVGYARAHATAWAEIAPGTWRASFALGNDPDPYARVNRLLHVVGSWKATEVQVAGSPEPLVPVLPLTECATAWLRRSAACPAPLPTGPWP